MTELQKYDEIKAAIEIAEPQERLGIDGKLSIIQKIAKKLRVDLNKQNEIAIARINNLRKLGDQLDEAREAGLIRAGRQGNTINSVLGTEFISNEIIRYADELNDCPQDEYNQWKQSHYFDADTANKEITVKNAYNEAKRYRLDKMRTDEELEPFETDRVILFNAPFQNVLPQMEADFASLIFTDPPYDEESIILYRDMADLSHRVITEGGSLISYCGHYAIPKIFEHFKQFPEWRFWWLNAVKHTGGRRTLQGKDVRVHWKPLLWFVKGGRYNTEFVDDFVLSTPPKKEWHDWEQSTEEAEYYIRMLSEIDDWILDPMMGYGTTGISALKQGRRFVGIEIDQEKFIAASNRIKQWTELNPIGNRIAN